MPYPPDNPIATSAAEPYLLVADDDAPTRYFLGDAFRQFGARVIFAASGHEALALARNETFDLLVLDCRMPGAGAIEILTRLRNEPEAGSGACPAVASSAELDAQAQQALLATGFHAVLLKPCTLADLRGVLALAAVGRRNLPLLDDGQAMHTSGTPAVVQALRGLLRQELLAINKELDELAVDPKALEARLHKLRSSCGFCGAASLSEHIVSLQHHLKLDHRGAMLPLTDFRRSVQETIEALPGA
ncbi:response regulator [Dyella choica]|uniref:Response regulator n=1 Tax=Dyella choica TaxID=1927959 RepID=A0A3S0PQ39_9GAMM|nr:response regulator [Dyella choica]RUL79673.1 response regulator [Dyella choica]